MNKTMKVGENVVTICSYSFTDPDGHIDTCRAPAKCPICGQCSRIVEEKEKGHCTGHLGLLDHVLEAVPNRGTV